MTTEEAIKRLDQMQGQILHGSNTFGEIADVIRRLENVRRAALYQVGIAIDTDATSVLLTAHRILATGRSEGTLAGEGEPADPPPGQERFSVRRADGYVELLIYPHGNGYPIEHSRMNTPQKVLGWVYHLTKKNNVTKEHLRRFIEVAKDLGVDVDLHA